MVKMFVIVLNSVELQILVDTAIDGISPGSKLLANDPWFSVNKLKIYFLYLPNVLQHLKGYGSLSLSLLIQTLVKVHSLLFGP